MIKCHWPLLVLQSLLLSIAMPFSMAWQSPEAVTNSKGPIKIFILAGQSNMQGHARTSTFDVIGLDPKTAPMLGNMRNKDGTFPECENVWISSIGSSEKEKTGKLTVGYGADQRGPKIGPEFTFGIYMQKHLKEPILIIKTAWGGKSINTDFRPPSAGPFVFRDEQLTRFREQGKNVEEILANKKKATGHHYRLMVEHIHYVLADIKRVYPDYDDANGYELSGFVWFQGWNDMVDGGTYPKRGQPGSYDAYSENLAHFIRDIRKELKSPKLPFVIGVMGAGGPVSEYGPEKKRYAGIHSEFRKAMAAPAALPEFRGNVIAIHTEKYWDMELEKLRAQDRRIQQELKALKQAGEIGASEEKSRLEQRRKDTFDSRELEILNKGASNFEFHYLGSAKIIGQIGKAFADANFELIKKK